MYYIDLKSDETQRLSFYLAMEEYVARHIYNGEDCFFMWRVNPTVICGRHQVIENEVNLDYCREHRINVFRRKSGGGCVYADLNNVMLSYITRGDNVVEAFDHYLALLTHAFNKAGFNAGRNDHNDIMLDGQKISGNAVEHIGGMIIAHGTMLYDTDMDNMTHAITPSHQKLSKNGVKSVRQRIALLKDYTTKSVEDIMQIIRQDICDKSLTLNEEDEKGVREIEKEYLPNAFLFAEA